MALLTVETLQGILNLTISADLHGRLARLIMWIRVKGGVSSQLVDESLKKNVVIKNKQAGWAGLLRSPLLSLSRGSRQVVTVVSCPVSSYL